MKLYVDNYWNARSRVQEIRPDAAISIMDGAHLSPDLGIPPERHLKLGFHDIERRVMGKIEPSPSHLSELIEFSRQQKAAGARSMFIHCAAGVRRSPAAAYIIAVITRHEDPFRAAHVLFQEAPFVDPNMLMIKHADRLAGLEGGMVQAILTTRKSSKVHEGQRSFCL